MTREKINWTRACSRRSVVFTRRWNPRLKQLYTVVSLMRRDPLGSPSPAKLARGPGVSQSRVWKPRCPRNLVRGPTVSRVVTMTSSVRCFTWEIMVYSSRMATRRKHTEYPFVCQYRWKINDDVIKLSRWRRLYELQSRF